MQFALFCMPIGWLDAHWCVWAWENVLWGAEWNLQKENFIHKKRCEHDDSEDSGIEIHPRNISKGYFKWCVLKISFSWENIQLKRAHRRTVENDRRACTQESWRVRTR